MSGLSADVDIFAGLRNADCTRDAKQAFPLPCADVSSEETDARPRRRATARGGRHPIPQRSGRARTAGTCQGEPVSAILASAFPTSSRLTIPTATKHANKCSDTGARILSHHRESNPVRPLPSAASSAGAGHLFVFEGPDGVGKTTLIGAVAQELAVDGYNVAIHAFPGREPGTLGALVYALHHDSALLGVENITPASLQLLHVAAHLDTIDRAIRRLLESGAVVLLDRFWWSTWVYGTQAGVRPDTLQAMIELERRHWGEVSPDVIYLLRRARSLREGCSSETFATRSIAYDVLADQEAKRSSVFRVDNDGSVAEASALVLGSIRHQLQGRSQFPSRPYAERES